MLLVKNCLLSDMAGLWDSERDILIENGKIVEIAKDISTGGKTVIDAKGRITTPGLVDSHCHTGGADTYTDTSGDINEMTNPTLAGLRFQDGIHYNDISFKDALKAGVTTTVTGPGSGNLIGGTFMAIKTYFGDIDSRIINPEVAMKMALGENPKLAYGRRDKAPSTRMMSTALIREQFILAKEYKARWEKHQEAVENGENPDLFKIDGNLHALMKAYDGMIVKFHVHQGDDIITAMRIAEEFDLNYTLDHCTEGHVIVDELKKYNPKCILGPVFGNKSKFELRHKSFEAAGILEENGVFFSIATDADVIPYDTILIQAALMVKNGLSREYALKALTINGAINSGIEDRVGSIEVGKDADIVIWSSDPILNIGDAQIVIVDGKVRYEGGDN